MADTGAKKSKKLEEEEELNELDKVGRTSEEIALNHQLEEKDESTKGQKLSGEKTERNVPLTETDIAAGEKQRDVLRHSEEQDVQQDLNQGMNTGTHDSSRHGVNWGKNYKVPAKGRGPGKKG
jgi:hypothetical protein